MLDWRSKPQELRHRYASLYKKARTRRLLYLWKPDKQANRHILICGGLGYCKTSFLKALVHDLHAKLGARIIVFDFYGEYRGLIRGLGGEIADLSGEPVNLLAPTDILYSESPRERERPPRSPQRSILHARPTTTSPSIQGHPRSLRREGHQRL